MANETKSIQSRLDIKNVNNLDKLAKLKGLSFSSMIRYILIEYIENNIYKLTLDPKPENK
ncbi:MAG: hypothetical protein ACM3MK_04025 [Chitinophagales bacterium]